LGHSSREGLREHFQNADVFVFPSFFEGFGLVILEAMACGLPVISSDATAAVDVADDSNGRIFPTGGLEPLIEHLRFFARDRGLLVAMGKSARAKAKTFTWEKYRKAVSAACENVG
jgi:glycosyltransferase involved in cell wall biosynthesis